MALNTPAGHALGLVLAPPDPRNWPYLLRAVQPPADTHNADRALPTGQQGQIGACTGWGGTATVEWYRRDGVQRSPRYVYYRDRQADGQNPPRQDTGATMVALCKALRDYGAPPEDAWPYDVANYNQIPSTDADAAAAQCRVDSFYQIQGTAGVLLQGMWAAIQEGPFPIALKVYGSFEQPEPGTGKVPLVGARESMLGGHCVMCLDWENDPNAPGGYGWWVLLNSWGTDMGDHGRWRVPAAYVTKNIIVEAHVLRISAAPPPEEETVDPAIYTLLDQAITEAVQITGDLDTARYDLRGKDDNAAWTYVGEGSRVQDIQKQRLLEIRDRLPKAPDPGPVDPTPTPSPTLQGVYGTYAGHGLAQDLYGGYTNDQVQWGPHHGLPIVAPCRGHVELYSFGVGASLLASADPVYARNHLALFAGWTCGVPALYALQQMYVAVFWPDEPLVIAGQQCGHLHYGHVRSDVLTGPVVKGQQFATSWDSGVHFESMGVPNARASHTHCCAGAGATLSPNGDLPGTLAVQAQGWTVSTLSSVPGPTDYQGGRYTAGRLTSDFTSAGKPIPPMPS